MAEFLNNYIDSVEPGMDFESKATYISSFDDLTSLIITIGGVLSSIIGIIGIANFVNSVLTSVITRKKEFAMLQSIGMTGRQLKRMLSFEGLYYAMGTIITSLVLGGSVFCGSSAGNFQRDLVLHLPLCYMAHAGDLSLPYTPDRGDTGAFVPANC